jgi:hypothetical protein
MTPHKFLNVACQILAQKMTKRANFIDPCQQPALFGRRFSESGQDTSFCKDGQPARHIRNSNASEDRDLPDKAIEASNESG